MKTGLQTSGHGGGDSHTSKTCSNIFLGCPQVDEGYLSQPESIAFPTTDGKTAYMNHYPPANKDFQLLDGAAPPLLVKIHGGPTASASTAFSLGIQFWTSRGGRLLTVSLRRLLGRADTSAADLLLLGSAGLCVFSHRLHPHSSAF